MLDYLRFTDPNDLMGMLPDGTVDERGVSRLEEASRSGRVYGSTPTLRAEAVLRVLFPKAIRSASSMERETAIFRLLLLDMATGLSRLGIVSQSDLRETKTVGAPSVETKLGALWSWLSSTGTFLESLGVDSHPWQRRRSRQQLTYLISEEVSLAVQRS